MDIKIEGDVKPSEPPNTVEEHLAEAQRLAYIANQRVNGRFNSTFAYYKTGEVIAGATMHATLALALLAADAHNETEV